jgi:hypothetical protein
MSTIDASKMDKYVNGKLVSKGKKEEGGMEGRYYWWKASEEEMANQIAATIKFIQGHQSTRIEQLTASTRLYGNASPFNFIGPALSRSASSSASASSNRISFNLCASVVDTMVSKIAKNKVVPQFITSGGVWGMQKKAENLSKFLEGCFHAEDVETKRVEMFRDGAVWGTGVVHTCEIDDKACVERVLPHELFIDQVEAISCNPRQLHRVKPVDREMLVEMFKDDDEAVEYLNTYNPATQVELGGVGTAADILIVSESWHLRSGKDATDGLHVITVGDKVLFKEEWTKDYFPFVFFRYVKNLVGFWGQGACERLQNLQSEINRGMITIQRSHWMMAGPKIACEVSSKIPAQHITNDVASILYYHTNPPQYLTPPIIQPEVYTWVDSLIAKGFQQEGVSQLAASSLKPEGVDSGAAMRTFDQIGDDRLLFIGQEVERCTLEIGNQLIGVVKDIYKRKKRYEAVFPQGKFLESIDWSDIKLDEEEYVLKSYPVSTLPDEPAGRLAYIQEQMQAGLITPRAGRKLMQMPDVEMSDKLANAPENLIDKIIEDMLTSEEEDCYRSPEPYYDLTLAKTIALQYYNYAALNNCPEEKMELLRRFMSQVDDLTGLTAQAQQQMQAAQQPMAAPMPTPQSNMIPNSAGGMQ